jgi:hypothetical protein
LASDVGRRLHAQRRPHARETLEHLHRLEYNDVEVIVVDDGSTGRLGGDRQRL